MWKVAPLLLALAAQVLSQQSLTLESAVSAALERHPVLVAAQERIASARGAQRQAQLRLNPRLNLQTENARIPNGTPPFLFWQQTDNFAFLQQTFETAGKRARRTDVASIALRRGELEYELERRRVALRVRQAYWAAAGAQKIVELLEANRRTFQQIVEYHEIRVREGNMAESDLLRVKLEADRWALAANSAQLDLNRARIQLFREMGQTEFPEARLADALELREDRLIDVNIDLALAQRPELELARTAMEEARARLALQQATAKPNYDVLFGYKRATGYDTVIAGLQVDLPFFNRNQGNVETATAEIRVAQANQAATEALVRAEVRAAAAEYELRRRQVREFMGRFRAQAGETSRIAVAAYRLGGADLLRLLDAERLRIEIELQNERALMEYRQSIVQLENALGVKP